MPHVYERQLEQYLLGRLKNGPAAEVKVHIAECESCGLKLAGNLRLTSRPPNLSRSHAYTGTERRGEPRIPVEDSALVRTIAPLSAGYAPVRLLDISGSGLRIRFLRYLEIGTVLQLRLGSSFILGEVKYCLRTDAGFDAGLHIQNVVRW